jgi:hypothetical protein
VAHRTKPWRLTIAATIVVTVAYGAWTLSRQPGSPTPRTATSTIAGIPAGAVVVDTRHYRIHSSASPKDATEIGQALEALYTAYGDLFPIANDPGRLPLILYRDRAEFSRNNRSSPWAEAYYLDPACYAYFDAAAPNPHHWAMHDKDSLAMTYSRMACAEPHYHRRSCVSLPSSGWDRVVPQR